MSWATLQNSKAFKEAKYYFKAFGLKGPQNRDAVMKIRKELLKIKRDYGELTVDAVLQEAENEDNILHKYFEWDDEIAADEYRRYQARRLIAAVYVQVKHPTEPDKVIDIQVFQNENVSSGGMTQKPYRPIEEVMADPKERMELLRTQLRAAQAWSKRCEPFEELIEVVEIIERLSKKYKV